MQIIVGKKPKTYRALVDWYVAPATGPIHLFRTKSAAMAFARTLPLADRYPTMVDWFPKGEPARFHISDRRKYVDLR